jgi:hypothetical protein
MRSRRGRHPGPHQRRRGSGDWAGHGVTCHQFGSRSLFGKTLWPTRIMDTQMADTVRVSGTAPKLRDLPIWNDRIFFGILVDGSSENGNVPPQAEVTEVISLLSKVRIDDLLVQSMDEYDAAADLDGHPEEPFEAMAHDPPGINISASVLGAAAASTQPSLSQSATVTEARPQQQSSVQAQKGQKARDKKRRSNQRRIHAQSRDANEQVRVPEPPPRTRRRLIIRRYGKPLITKTDFCAKFLPMAEGAYVGKALKTNATDLRKIFSLSDLLLKGFQVIKWDGR